MIKMMFGLVAFCACGSVAWSVVGNASSAMVKNADANRVKQVETRFEIFMTDSLCELEWCAVQGCGVISSGGGLAEWWLLGRERSGVGVSPLAEVTVYLDFERGGR